MFLISFIHCILSIATLHLFIICCLKDNSWSIHVPRYLMQLLWEISSPFALIFLVKHFFSCCLEPNRMNSVLALFIWSQLWSIQVLISVRQFSVSAIAFASHSGTGKKLVFSHDHWHSHVDPMVPPLEVCWHMQNTVLDPHSCLVGPKI